MMVRQWDEYEIRRAYRQPPRRNALQVAANVLILGLLAGGLLWGGSVIYGAYAPEYDGRPIEASYELAE